MQLDDSVALDIVLSIERIAKWLRAASRGLEEGTEAPDPIMLRSAIATLEFIAGQFSDEIF